MLIIIGIHNPENFFTYLVMNLSTTSENLTTVPCEMQSCFIGLKLHYFAPNWVVLQKLMVTVCGISISDKQHHKNCEK